MQEISLIDQLLDVKNYVFELRCKFQSIEKQKWDFKKGISEFLVQLGHLMYAFLKESKDIFDIEEKGRNIHDINDEVADCYLQLFGLTIFLGWTNEDYLKIVNRHLKEKPSLDVSDNLSKLVIIGTQLLESTMRVNGERFPVTRKPHYESELSFINHKMGQMLFLLLSILEVRQIDLNKIFHKMYLNASNFVDNFSSLTSKVKEAELEYKIVRKHLKQNADVFSKEI